MLKTKAVSSQVKAFIDDKIDSFSECGEISALGGETVSFQILYVDEGDDYLPVRPFTKVEISGELSECATLRDVRFVPVDRPVNPIQFDDQYLRTVPGIYPDLLTPIRYGGKVCPSRDKLRSIWVDVEIPADFSGSTELCVKLSVENPDVKDVKSEHSIRIDVIPAALPEQELLYTQWFYADCLASYYNVEAFSEKHWEIIENFVKLAVKRGRNVIYTPLLTPSLNVIPDYYRNPTQLVRVERNGEKYSFDFSLLDRWIDMCDAIGVKMYEFSHFYQQDKAYHAAHVYAAVDGEYRRLFGWETLSIDPEYVRFLRELITALIAHLKDRGDDRRCIYHISDEPDLANLDQYKKVKSAIIDLIGEYRIIDAVSDFEFYETGALDSPVPTLTSAKRFIDAKIPNLWVYYACCELVGYTNCYVAMPSWRTRSLGFQLFKHENIEGFLHWGYNYYNNAKSGNAINPYVDLGGEDWVPAGDTFVVYPGEDGRPLESVRILTLEEAMQDYRAMKLAQKYYSHDEVVAEIEKVLGEEITFERCARSEQEMLAIRAAVNSMIKRALEK